MLDEGFGNKKDKRIFNDKKDALEGYEISARRERC